MIFGMGRRLTGAGIAKLGIVCRAIDRSGTGAPGAADSAGEAWWTAAQTDMRSAMNAIFYLLRTGCPWPYLPRRVFPPRSTVYNIFRAFQRQGAWEGKRDLTAACRPASGLD